jgi:hypothetical protein
MAEGEIHFEDWAKGVGLNQKTLDLLTKQDLSDLKALKVFDIEDVHLLKLTMGQAALLADGLRKLQTVQVSPIDIVYTEPEKIPEPVVSDDQILAHLRGDPTLKEAVNKAIGLGSGNPWGELLGKAQSGSLESQSNHVSNQGSSQNAVFDPVYYLRPKSTSKYHDITEFVAPKKGDFEEVISSKEGVEIVIRSQDKGTKKVQLSSVSVTQWNIANTSILYQLMVDGTLALTSISDYLAYTIKVLELSYHHEWSSVLIYDREYRSKQAAYGFRWGTDPPHLGASILIPRSFQRFGNDKSFNDKGSFSEKRTSKPPNQRPRKLTTRKGEEICLAFNSKGGCRWGSACRYLHVCSEKGCEGRHPQFDHPKG